MTRWIIGRSWCWALLLTAACGADAAANLGQSQALSSAGPVAATCNSTGSRQATCNAQCPALKPVAVDATCEGQCRDGSTAVIEEKSISTDPDALRCRASCTESNARVRARLACESLPSEACTWGSTETCASYTGPTGVEIALGPYRSVMEPNVGAGFEVPIASGDSDGNAQCTIFLDALGEDPVLTAQWRDITGLDMALHTIYRPALFIDGELTPIVIWGNSTCMPPETYGSVLRHLSSHGFFVIAPNSRWVGGNGALALALDFAFAINEDPASPYYGRLDTTRVGVMGHGQGASATAAVSSDSRVSTVVMLNGNLSAAKPFLILSGDRDLGQTPASMQAAIDAAPEAAFIYYHKVPETSFLSGYLLLALQPERVVMPTTSFWQYMLKDDLLARSRFVGDDCQLCTHPDELTYGQHGLH